MGLGIREPQGPNRFFSWAGDFFFSEVAPIAAVLSPPGCGWRRLKQPPPTKNLGKNHVPPRSRHHHPQRDTPFALSVKPHCGVTWLPNHTSLLLDPLQGLGANSANSGHRWKLGNNTVVYSTTPVDWLLSSHTFWLTLVKVSFYELGSFSIAEKAHHYK